VNTERYPSYQTMQGVEGQPAGLGGWLVLPIIGLFLSPMQALVRVVNDVAPALRSDVWETLTTPGTQAYHPLWAPILLFDAVSLAVMIVAPIFLLYFLFRRRAILPRLMIYFLLFVLGSVLIDWGVLHLFIAPALTQIDAEVWNDSLPDLARGILGAAIWLPYFLLSKRVKNTFVR